MEEVARFFLYYEFFLVSRSHYYSKLLRIQVMIYHEASRRFLYPYRNESTFKETIIDQLKGLSMPIVNCSQTKYICPVCLFCAIFHLSDFFV